MKNIKKMLICFSLCLIMGNCIPVSVEAAACSHSCRKVNNGVVEIVPCTYQNYTESVCSNCGVRVFYTLVGEQFTNHRYTTEVTSYKTYDGRTVTVYKYSCTKCGHTYSTSSVS